MGEASERQTARHMTTTPPSNGGGTVSSPPELSNQVDHAMDALWALIDCCLHSIPPIGKGQYQRGTCAYPLPRIFSRFNRPLVFFQLLRRGWFGRAMEMDLVLLG